MFTGGGETCLKRYNILNLANIIYNHFTNLNNSINILEFGVAHGDTSKMLIDEFENSTFFLFDTFNGLPSPTFEDEKSKNIIGNYKFTLQEVKSLIGDKNNVNYIQGLVQNTLLSNLPQKIHFVHLDLDLYEPTLYVLDNIINKMASPSIIVIDDYGQKFNNGYIWKGIKKACDEIEIKYKVKFNLLNKNTQLTQAILYIN